LTKIFEGAIIEIGEKMRTLKKYLVPVTLAALLTIGIVTAAEIIPVYKATFKVKVIEPIKVTLLTEPESNETFPETALTWVFEVKNLDTKPWNVTYMLEISPSAGLNSYFSLLIDPDGPGEKPFEWTGKTRVSVILEPRQIQYVKVYAFTQADARGEFSFDFVVIRASAAKG
jgi:hypothetical protein